MNNATYSGTLSYNAGRANGYNYYQSFAFAIGGSLMWEYFGENTRPSYNDIINTPIDGAFLGEVLCRLSSNILDDRTRGTERVFREIAGGLINPIRGFNRLLQWDKKNSNCITTTAISGVCPPFIPFRPNKKYFCCCSSKINNDGGTIIKMLVKTRSLMSEHTY